jgi:hypothetical protein
MSSPKLTLEDLYVCYGHLQGQVAAVNTIAAALAALHPDKATIERVLHMTESSDGFQRDEAPAAGQDAYREGMAYAIRVFRAAMAGMAPLTS